MGDVKLRPHHLLCIQGFRGQGYSPKFIANMARLTDRLHSNPELTVRIVSGPDDICLECPHLRINSCARPGEDVVELDHKVLAELGLSVGATSSWSSLLSVIRKKITPGQINSICPNCRWRDLNFCSVGLEAMGVRPKA